MPPARMSPPVGPPSRARDRSSCVSCRSALKMSRDSTSFANGACLGSSAGYRATAKGWAGHGRLPHAGWNPQGPPGGAASGDRAADRFRTRPVVTQRDPYPPSQPRTPAGARPSGRPGRVCHAALGAGAWLNAALGAGAWLNAALGAGAGLSPSRPGPDRRGRQAFAHHPRDRRKLAGSRSRRVRRQAARVALSWSLAARAGITKSGSKTRAMSPRAMPISASSRSDRLRRLS